MGRDKALLGRGETDFLQHTLDRLRAVCPEVLILSGETPRHAERGSGVLTDPGIGPLGAFLAGLDHSPWGLFLAVDLPEIPTAFLAYLVGAAREHDAVIPVSPGGPEPLCAVYGPRCRDAIARRVAAGERKATAFLPDVAVRYVSGPELEAFGDPEVLFWNVNAPGDVDGPPGGGG
jgi:molybdopterin-guanine dinucleotide biosynthesis protein A